MEEVVVESDDEVVEDVTYVVVRRAVVGTPAGYVFSTTLICPRSRQQHMRVSSSIAEMARISPYCDGVPVNPHLVAGLYL